MHTLPVTLLQAVTLPASFYTQPAALQLEKTHVLYNTWQVRLKSCTSLQVQGPPAAVKRAASPALHRHHPVPCDGPAMAVSGRCCAVPCYAVPCRAVSCCRWCVL